MYSITGADDLLNLCVYLHIHTYISATTDQLNYQIFGV